jgi:molybdopterin-containing oxidoreductase family membrane subunit
MAASYELDPLSGRAPLILSPASAAGQGYRDLTEAVAEPMERTDYRGWWVIFSLALVALGIFGIAVCYLFWEGTGIWGINNPVGWGWAIVNFVFWVGIGHAGTLISAILFLFRQKWRTAINRSAEAMTIFAVICALMFPGLHMGRIWLFYWMFPIPNQMDVWPNFRSPLLWDVFAVGTYFTVSLLFWFVGLVPDLATMRDRSKTKLRRVLYGVFSLGWRGSNRHWQNYERAYLILAALATPLVLSVHTVVSFDFAVAQLPGWHTTIFPPYFVAGAIFSGFAMVLTLVIPARKFFKLEHLVTIKHLENMAKIITLTGSMVGYAYAMEFFIAWYSGNPYEQFAFVNRAFGDYAWAYWTMITCNVISPQLFWSKRIRQSPVWLFVISIFVNIGMWFERFVITVSSLAHDFVPSSWEYYSPTIWDAACLLGSFGVFMTLFCLFARYLPFVALAEVKAVLPEANPHYEETTQHAEPSPVHRPQREPEEPGLPDLALAMTAEPALAGGVLSELVSGPFVPGPEPTEEPTRAHKGKGKSRRGKSPDGTG